MPKWLLRMLHRVGLTNLSNDDVQRACKPPPTLGPAFWAMHREADATFARAAAAEAESYEREWLR